VLSALALAVCAQEGLAVRCNHLDPTRFALSGEDVPDRDERAMTSTHGYAKAHRPDLQQAVLAWMVSHEGGVPLVSPSWDGHAADPEMFQARAAALIATFQHSSTPRSFGAASQLDNDAKAANLHALGVITRMPHTRTLVSHVITQARPWDTWPRLDATTRSQRVA
jgi:hypothetical protein